MAATEEPFADFRGGFSEGIDKGSRGLYAQVERSDSQPHQQPLGRPGRVAQIEC